MVVVDPDVALEAGAVGAAGLLDPYVVEAARVVGHRRGRQPPPPRHCPGFVVVVEKVVLIRKTPVGLVPSPSCRLPGAATRAARRSSGTRPAGRPRAGRAASCPRPLPGLALRAEHPVAPPVRAHSADDLGGACRDPLGEGRWPVTADAAGATTAVRVARRCDRRDEGDRQGAGQAGSDSGGVGRGMERLRDMCRWSRGHRDVDPVGEGNLRSRGGPRRTATRAPPPGARPMRRSPPEAVAVRRAMSRPEPGRPGPALAPAHHVVVGEPRPLVGDHQQAPAVGVGGEVDVQGGTVGGVREHVAEQRVQRRLEVGGAGPHRQRSGSAARGSPRGPAPRPAPCQNSTRSATTARASHRASTPSRTGRRASRIRASTCRVELVDVGLQPVAVRPRGQRLGVQAQRGDRCPQPVRQVGDRLALVRQQLDDPRRQPVQGGPDLPDLVRPRGLDPGRQVAAAEPLGGAGEVGDRPGHATAPAGRRPGGPGRTA